MTPDSLLKWLISLIQSIKLFDSASIHWLTESVNIWIKCDESFLYDSVFRLKGNKNAERFQFWKAAVIQNRIVSAFTGVIVFIRTLYKWFTRGIYDFFWLFCQVWGHEERGGRYRILAMEGFE